VTSLTSVLLAPKKKDVLCANPNTSYYQTANVLKTVGQDFTLEQLLVRHVQLELSHVMPLLEVSPASKDLSCRILVLRPVQLVRIIVLIVLPENVLNVSRPNNSSI